MHGLQEMLPIKIDRLETIVCGLGGGFSLTGLVCGAVSGAAVAMGNDIAGRISNPVEARYYIENATRKFIKGFEEKFGTTLCRQLTGVDFIGDGKIIPDPEAVRQFREEGAGQKCLEFPDFAIKYPLPSEDQEILAQD